MAPGFATSPATNRIIPEGCGHDQVSTPRVGFLVSIGGDEPANGATFRGTGRTTRRHDPSRVEVHAVCVVPRDQRLAGHDDQDDQRDPDDRDACRPGLDPELADCGIPSLLSNSAWSRPASPGEDLDRAAIAVPRRTSPVSCFWSSSTRQPACHDRRGGRGSPASCSSSATFPRSTFPAVDGAGDLEHAAIVAAVEFAGLVLLVYDLAVEVVAGDELELGVLPFYARPAAARADCAAAANGRRWFASGARPSASSTAIQRAPHA